MKIRLVSFLMIACFIGLAPPIYDAEEKINNDMEEEVYDAEKVAEEVESQLIDTLLLEEVTFYWNELGRSYGDYVPELTEKNFSEIVKSGQPLTIKTAIKGFMSYLFYEIVLNGKLLGTLIILTLFALILQSLHNAFEQRVVRHVAYFVFYTVLLFVTLSSFYTVFQYARNTVDTMGSFLLALLPLLLSLIAASGQMISVTFFHPIIIFLIHVTSIVVHSFVLPLLYLAALLVVISYMNKEFQATQLAQLLRSVSIGTIGLIMTIFLGVMSVQGAATVFQDGIALKTTKFIAGNFIPVVGRTLTDAADTVLSATLLLKNTIGIIGLLMIVFIAAFPAIKIAVIAFMYKVVAALLQPLGDNPIIQSLNAISTYIMYIFACIVIVTFMFFLSVVIIVALSNIPLLLA